MSDLLVDTRHKRVKTDYVISPLIPSLFFIASTRATGEPTFIPISLWIPFYFSYTDIQRLYAARYAIDQVNKQDYLYGYKLRHVENNFPYVNNEFPETIQSWASAHLSELLVHGIIRDGRDTRRVEQLFIQNGITGTITAIHSKFSGELNYDAKAFKLFKMVPSESYRIRALCDLLKKLGVNYFSIIVSSEKEGGYEADDLKSCMFPNDEVSLFRTVNIFNEVEKGSFHKIDKTKEREHHIRYILRELSENKNLKTLILFTTPFDTYKIWMFLEKLHILGRFFLIFGDGQCRDPTVSMYSKNIFHGSLCIDFYHEEHEGFRKYILNETEFTFSDAALFFNSGSKEVLFPCYPYKQCLALDEERKIRFTEGKGYFPEVAVHDVIQGVYVIAHQIKQWLEKYCDVNYESNVNKSQCFIDDWLHRASELYNSPKPKKLSYKDFPMNDLASFYDNNSYNDGTPMRTVPWDPIKTKEIHLQIFNYLYNNSDGAHRKTEFKQIGSWKMPCYENIFPYEAMEKYHHKISVTINTDVIITPNGGNISDYIHCSKDCLPGYKRFYTEKLSCWECKKCPFNHYSSSQHICTGCEIYETADLLQRRCVSLPLKKMEFLHVDSMAVLFFSALGVLVLVVYIGILLKTRDLPIWNTVQWYVWIFVFMFLIALLATPVLFIMEIDFYRCYIRTGFFASFQFCLCAVLSKIWLQNHHPGETAKRLPDYVTFFYCVLIGGLTSQGLFAYYWAHKATVTLVPSHDRSYVFKKCSAEDELKTGLNFLLAFCISACGFSKIIRSWYRRTNYFESRCLTVSALICCVGIVVYVISYSVVRAEKLEDIYATCWYCVTTGWSQIVIIFFMKFKHILCSKVEHEKKRSRTKSTTAMLEKNANDQYDLKAFIDLHSNTPGSIQRNTLESEAIYENIDA